MIKINRMIKIRNYPKLIDSRFSKEPSITIYINHYDENSLKTEYELTDQDERIVEQISRRGHRKIYTQELIDIIGLSSIDIQKINSHPLVKTKVLRPNEVSEYGRIENYILDQKVWKIFGKR